MGPRIICFSLGLSEEEIEKGKASFYSLNTEAPLLEVIAITKAMIDLPVGKVLENILNGSGLNATGGQKDSDVQLFPEPFKYRVVVVHTQERERVLQVMKSFKAVLPDPQNIIFAVITETALNWTFGEYIGHLGEEHEYMKNRNPER
jgi:hypothetical protein